MSVVGYVLCTLALIALIALSSVISASETAYSSLNAVRLEREAQHGGRAALANEIKTHFAHYITPILIGNTLVNQVVAMLGTLIFVAWLGPSGAALSTVVVTIILVIAGEVAPKIGALKAPNRLAVRLAGVVKALSVLFAPISLVANALSDALKQHIPDTGSAMSEEEVETLIDTVQKEGVFDDGEADLIRNITRFDDQSAFEIATPRVDVVGIDLTSSQASWHKVAATTHFSRIPVYSDSPDDPKGVVLLEDYLDYLISNRGAGCEDEKRAILSMVRPPVFVHATMKIDEVYKLMMKKREHMVFVSDEFGGTAGILTMEDILETLFGEIWDEDEKIERIVEKAGEGDYLVDGAMTVSDLFENFDLKGSPEEYESSTVGGLAVEALDHFAKVGDKFTVGGATATVTKVQGRRVDEVRIHKEIR